MKYDQLVNKLLTEAHFGGSPYEQATGIKRHINTEEEEQEMDNISGAEAKAMQDMLNQTIAQQRGGKKKSALQMVDANQLSPEGREFLETLIKSTELYQQGSAIGGDKTLRGDIQLDMEDDALRDTFGSVELEYIGKEREKSPHEFRYPSPGEGDVGVPHDKDGFRIEAQIDGDFDPDGPVALYPLDRFDVVRWFGKGGPLPIATKGRITQG